MTSVATSAEPPPRKRRFWDVLSALSRPRVALMLAMGVSSGLPFALIGNTLGAWLKLDGVSNTAIGFASWVGMTYTIKFVWGAVVDRIRIPALGRLGRRRSWMLVAQLTAGVGLVGIGLSDPKTQFGLLVAFAAVAALGAATQDTAMDAWRIEIAADSDELGLLTSVYSIGYRIALIFTESVILMSAKRLGWPISYEIYGAAMAIGVVAVLLAREPAAADAVMEARDRAQAVGLASPVDKFFRLVRAHGVAVVALALWIAAFLSIDTWAGWGQVACIIAPAIAGAGVHSLLRRIGDRSALLAGAALLAIDVAGFYLLGWNRAELAPTLINAFTLGFAGSALLVHLASIDAIAGPFIAFFQSHGITTAALMLLMITFFHLCDYMRGPMTLPYYTSLKIDYDTIGLTRAVFGTPATFLGIALGGLSSLRLGNRPTLIVGAIIQPLAIGSFALLGFHGGDYPLFAKGGVSLSAFQAIMTCDAVAIGYSGVALVAYMSTLTSLGYTATQYALMTSALAFTGKFLKGFSGAIVDALQQGRTPDQAFALFYLLAAALGAPAIGLSVILARRTVRPMLSPG
jgi:PAT family beta-lactamase induction signal transducer AmpG